jgi:hypothetical protein
VVERLHPRIHPLAAVLPRLLEPLPVQLPRIGAQHLAAQPLDRLHLDPLGPAQPTGRLNRAHVPLERLAPGELLQLGRPLVGRPRLEGGQQRPGRQLGARVGAQQGGAALGAGGRVQALEHRPHLLGAGLAVQAGGGGG